MSFYEKTFDALYPNGTRLDFRVLATDIYGNTERESEIPDSYVTLYYDAVSPNVPSTGGEPSGVTLTDTTPDFTWDQITDDINGSGMKRYEVQLSGDESFNAPVSFSVVNDDFENRSGGIGWTRFSGGWDFEGGAYRQKDRLGEGRDSNNQLIHDRKEENFVYVADVGADVIVKAKLKLNELTPFAEDTRVGIFCHSPNGVNDLKWALVVHDDPVNGETLKLQSLEEHIEWKEDMELPVNYVQCGAGSTPFWLKMRVEGNKVYGTIWREGEQEPDDNAYATWQYKVEALFKYNLDSPAVGLYSGDYVADFAYSFFI